MSDNASQTNEKKHFEPIVELTPSEKPEAPEAVIKVIGVGGGGGNAVSNMYRENVEGVRFLVCNTDAKALAASLVPEHVQLGPGLGAGGRPERGRELAEENVEAIREALEDDLNMVFITAGMGGGTGTGAAPEGGTAANHCTVAVLNRTTVHSRPEVGYAAVKKNGPATMPDHVLGK